MAIQEPQIASLWNVCIDAGSPVLSQADRQIVLEQYKIYVESTDKFVARRDSIHQTFVNVNSAIVGFIGLSADKLLDLSLQHRWLLFLPTIGLCLACTAWWTMISSYRQLSGVKYRVIGEFERALPASPWWGGEWISVGQGLDPKRYRPLTHVEGWVPWVFMLVYGLIFVLVLVLP
jgi:hypothetical protein